MSGQLKRALVTGGSDGLGATLVRWLLSHGFSVVSLDRMTPKTMQNSAPGQSFRHIQCDLSDRDQLDTALEDAVAAGPYDVVLLNAGVSATGAFEEIDLASHLAIIRVNAEAPMILAARMLDAKSVARGGAMGFVSSLSHFTGYPGAASYAASKDALAVFAKSMRKAAKARGVAITTAFPGPLRTDHAERHAPKGADASKRMDPDQAAKWIMKAVLAGRKTVIPGTTNRILAALSWLAPNMITAQMRRLIYERLE